jgi:hypothetical protein
MLVGMRSLADQYYTPAIVPYAHPSAERPLRIAVSIDMRRVKRIAAEFNESVEAGMPQIHVANHTEAGTHD